MRNEPKRAEQDSWKKLVAGIEHDVIGRQKTTCVCMQNTLVISCLA